MKLGEGFFLMERRSRFSLKKLNFIGINFCLLLESIYICYEKSLKKVLAALLKIGKLINNIKKPRHASSIDGEPQPLGS